MHEDEIDRVLREIELQHPPHVGKMSFVITRRDRTVFFYGDSEGFVRLGLVLLRYGLCDPTEDKKRAQSSEVNGPFSDLSPIKNIVSVPRTPVGLQQHRK